MEKDIDLIIREIRSRYPLIEVEQLVVRNPDVDHDGLWFFNLYQMEIQLESSTGNCPFLIESNSHNRRLGAQTIQNAIAMLELELYNGITEID